MKETHLPESQKREAVFICLSVAAVILCAALAFYFAVPLQDTAVQPLPDTAGLEQHILVDLNTAGLSALCTLPGVGESRARAILEPGAERPVCTGRGCSLRSGPDADCGGFLERAGNRELSRKAAGKGEYYE